MVQILRIYGVLILFSFGEAVSDVRNSLTCAGDNYIFSKDKKTFQEARRSCRAQQADLIAIELKPEDDVVAQLAVVEEKVGQTFYTSGSNRHGRGDLKWESTGVSLATSYSPDAEGSGGEKACEPLNTCLTVTPAILPGTERVYLSRKYTNCSSQQYYICEKQSVECSLPVTVKDPKDSDATFDPGEHTAEPLQNPPKLVDCIVLSHCEDNIDGARKRCERSGYGDLTPLQEFIKQAVVDRLVIELANDEQFYVGIGIVGRSARSNHADSQDRQKKTAYVVSLNATKGGGSTLSVIKVTDLKPRRFLCQRQSNDCRDLSGQRKNKHSV